MRWVGVLLLLLLPAPAHARDFQATLFVENATTAQDLISILREEMPASAFAETAALADLRARLSEALRLSIVDRAGVTMVDRSLEGGRDAAVRVAALLIVEARQTWRPTDPIRAETAVTATVASDRGWSIGASAGVGLSLWTKDPTPQLVVPLSVYVAISDFQIGVGGSIGGFVTVETAALRGEPRAYALWLHGRWSFWRPIDLIDTSLLVAAGLQTESIDARVTATPGGFAADGPLESRDFGWDPFGRLGLGIDARVFGWLHVRADVAFQMQTEGSVRLPDYPEYMGIEEREIGRGMYVVWSALSIGFEI